MIPLVDYKKNIVNWLSARFNSTSNKVMIKFSVVQTAAEAMPFSIETLDQVRKRLNLRFPDCIYHIGDAHFYLVLSSLQLIDVVKEFETLQSFLRLSFHMGVGVPTIDKNDAVKSASDAWKASLRLNRNGAFVDFSTFFSRDEIARFITGNDSNKFILFYQKKICHNGFVVGYEALARLVYNAEILAPNKNNARSCDFLQAVSANGLQWQFDYWLIKQVSVHVNSGVHISINLLASALTDELASHIIESISNYSCLEIEILEHEVLSRDSLSVIKKMHDKGVVFSVDDFGRGVSNIDLLRILPSGSSLKVDHSFVLGSDQETEDAQRQQLTQRAIAELAKIYSLKIVFEGVENCSIFNNLCKLIFDIGIDQSHVKFQGAVCDGMPKAWEDI
ncbi:MAG: EAL domain-containing protein [Magnetococcales bacterium]|nr:EAL domain-containing protein [Magnetococcales bacterium]